MRLRIIKGLLQQGNRKWNCIQ